MHPKAFRHESADLSVSKWAGKDRNGEDGLTMQLMAEVRLAMEKHEEMEQRQFKELESEIKGLSKRLDSLCTSVTAYIENTPDRIIERIEELIDDAFPDDPDMPDATPSEKRKLHRKYHANLIKKMLKDAERKESLIDKLTAWAAQNALTIVAISLFAYFNIKVGA